MAALQRSKKRVIVFSAAGVLVIALVLLLVLGSKKDAIVPVQVEEAQKRTITQIVTASGKIRPEFLVNISAEVSGELIALPVKEGDRVKKGELLVRIKPDVYIAAVNQAEAGYRSAKASLEKAEADYHRAKELFAKKLNAEQDLQMAKMTYDVAKAGADQAKAGLDRAKEDLSKTSIYSPLDGTVSKLNSQLGERVLGTSFMSGTVIMTIADLTKMEGIMDVSENDVVLVHIGDTTSLDVDAVAGKKFRGVVKEIANTAATTGLGTQQEVVNFPVKVRIVGDVSQLRPGMSATGDIQTQTKSDVLSVPIQSVTTRAPKQPPAGGQEGGAPAAAQASDAKKKVEKPTEIVFVVKDGKVKAVPVERGISDDSHVEITKGLSGGETIVSGSFKAINTDLQDGMAVKVEKSRATSGKGS